MGSFFLRVFLEVLSKSNFVKFRPRKIVEVGSTVFENVWFGTYNLKGFSGRKVLQNWEGYCQELAKAVLQNWEGYNVLSFCSEMRVRHNVIEHD
jgi:hypothetical protein